MTQIRYKVTDEKELIDLLVKCEDSGFIWINGGEKPTQWNPVSNSEVFNLFPIWIELNFCDSPSLKEIHWGIYTNDIQPIWKIGQSLPDFPKTALEDLISIPQNEDGSITISPELQDKLVVALRGGEQ